MDLLSISGRMTPSVQDGMLYPGALHRLLDPPEHGLNGIDKPIEIRAFLIDVRERSKRPGPEIKRLERQ